MLPILRPIAKRDEGDRLSSAAGIAFEGYTRFARLCLGTAGRVSTGGHTNLSAACDAVGDAVGGAVGGAVGAAVDGVAAGAADGMGT